MALQRRPLYFHSSVLLYLFPLPLSSPFSPAPYTHVELRRPLFPLTASPGSPGILATYNEYHQPPLSALSRFSFKILRFFIKIDAGLALINELKDDGEKRRAGMSGSGLNSPTDRCISLASWANDVARNFSTRVSLFFSQRNRG